MMLEKLLNEIHSGGTTTSTALAQRLGTSVEMVTAMLEHLNRLGLLKDYQPACGDSACTGCNLSSVCRADTKPRLWTT